MMEEAEVVTHQRVISPIHPTRWVMAAVLCALLFAADLVCVETGVTAAEDSSLDRSLHSTFGPRSYHFFELMSIAGGGTVRVVILALIVVGLTVIRYWWSAALTIVVSGGAALLGTLIKLLVGRPRPHLFPHVVSAGGTSFPSGHATSACSFALLIVFLVWHLSGRRSLTIAVGILLLAFVVLVGLSRVVLGVHYPTDVAGGYALGAGWTALAFAVFSTALHEERSRGPAGRVS